MYVVARFLNALYSSGSAMKKTNIQMLLGVNYSRFIEYFEWMEKRGLVVLVVDDSNAERIALTSKRIEAYHRFVDWIKETLEGAKI